MKRPIDLAGFEARFNADPDPWNTFSARTEYLKRMAILRAAGTRRRATGLELAAGNGSNTLPLSRCVLRLDVCEGTRSGVDLILGEVGERSRIRVHHLVLPGRFPRQRYDLIVIAELLYYMPSADLLRMARDVSRSLAPGGRLILAHHHQAFADARAPGLEAERRFLAAISPPLQSSRCARTGRWQVSAWDRTLL